MKPRITLRYFDNSFVICTINHLILKNMKKVWYVFVAIIGMLAITSCLDRQQCVGNWVSDSVTDEGFTGKFYLDLRENGTATLNIKGSGAVEEEGMNIKVGVSAKINGKWDVSMEFMDLVVVY